MQKKKQNKFKIIKEAKEFLSALFLKRTQEPVASLSLYLWKTKRRGNQVKANTQIEGHGKRQDIVLLMSSLLENPEMKPLVKEAMQIVMGKELQILDEVENDPALLKLQETFKRIKLDRSREKEKFN